MLERPDEVSAALIAIVERVAGSTPRNRAPARDERDGYEQAA
jgi:hypothetical protein